MAQLLVLEFIFGSILVLLVAIVTPTNHRPRHRKKI
jgi:hypothetical protein